ncbi:MAG: divergent polysaccharide deacetylase family protein [Caulobacterales bacterium]
MPRKGPQVRSPAHAVYLHPVLSVATLALIGGGAYASIAFFGDPNAAGPRAIVKLTPVAEGPLRAPLADVVIDPSLDAIDEAPLGEAQVHMADASDKPAVEPLPAAPFQGLSVSGPNGQLPVMGPGGLTSYKAYRRPFTPDPRKSKIGVIVGGLGFNAAATEQAISELPPEITLSFVPYAQNLQSWIDKARAAGHEVMIEVPMEPFDMDEDTGPQTLLAGLDAKSNVSRLEYLLGRAVGYFAVMNYQGAKFSTSPTATPPVLKALKDRGLALVGNGLGPRSALGAEATKQGLPFASADRVLDIRRDAEAIDDQLLNLEALALQNGSALGAGFAYPVTIEQIKFWADGLKERGYQLAPASTVMDLRAKPK